MGGAKAWAFASVFLFLSVARADVSLSGLCDKETSETGLAKAVCHMPTCPAGKDCDPPRINRQTAFIDFTEPMIQWQERCPKETKILGPCWDMRLGFHFSMDASDPSGVVEIGPQLSQEVVSDPPKRVIETYLASVNMAKSGNFESTGEIRSYVPIGKQFDVSVYQICAADSRGNIGCVVPSVTGTLPRPPVTPKPQTPPHPVGTGVTPPINPNPIISPGNPIKIPLAGEKPPPG